MHYKTVKIELMYFVPRFIRVSFMTLVHLWSGQLFLCRVSWSDQMNYVFYGSNGISMCQDLPYVHFVRVCLGHK